MGFELEALCENQNPQPKSGYNRDHRNPAGAMEEMEAMAERVGLYPTQLVVGTRWDAFF